MPSRNEALLGRWASILLGLPGGAADLWTGPAVAVMSREAVELTARARSGLPCDSSMTMRQSFQLLRSLAVAYRTPGTAQYGDAAIAADIIDGLEFLHQRAYHAGAAPTGNWWDWEIGTPHALLDTCVLLYDRLAPDRLASYLAAVEHFVPVPDRQQSGVNVSTGANRSDLCQVLILGGLLGDRADRIREGVEALPAAFAWTDAGDGLHRDGSFIQHYNIPYTGLYGVILLQGLADLFALLAGTPWSPSSLWGVTDVGRAALETFAPVMWNGQVFDAVRGRGVVRSYRSAGRDGRQVIGALLRLAEDAPPDTAARYRSLAKGWILRDRHEPFATHATVAQLALAGPVLDDPAVPAEPEPVGHRQFPGMDRVVHRRPGWAFVISMASARIGRYEGGPVENENLRGWHTGAGMTYLYLDEDQGQFADGFWPTVDPYRLPGTTVDTLPLASGDGYRETTSADWVGGATLGPHGAAGMVLEGLGSGAVGSSLRAVKSWFCLDDGVIALGAGINAHDGRTIETVVDNRRLGDVRLVVDGRVHEGAAWQAVHKGARWAHLAGVGGYRFLDDTTLRVKAEDRTGSHRDIGPTDPDATVLTRRYCTMWIDHGTDPDDAGYAYLLLPGADERRTVERPAPTVIANTAAVQAINDPVSGVTAANFFAAGGIPGLSVSGPASVLFRAHDGRIEVAVADPTRSGADLVVTLDHLASGPVQGDASIEVVGSAPAPLALRIRTGKAGATHSVRIHGID